MRAAADGLPIVELMEGVIGVDEGLEGRSSHSLDIGLRWPVMTVLPFRVMTAEVLVKVAVQPLSHNCPMDMREPDAREGNKWTSLAAEGKCGKSRFALCVAWILS